MTRPTRGDAAGRAYLDLQNIARKTGRGTQELLVLYALERFLARLAAGPHAGTFVLKGGMLLAALNARRPTIDADLLATQMADDEHSVLTRVRDIAGTGLDPDDGVTYELDTARARSIRESDHYAGVRVTMDAHVARAAVKLQLDINFGDPVTPAPVEIVYPTLREGDPPVHVLGYPLATVLAEKLTTAITMGTANSRVRDYADIWTLTRIHDVDAAELHLALETTARYRGIRLRPLSDVVGGLGTARQDTYAAYRRHILEAESNLPRNLEEVIEAVIHFADPVLAGSATGTWRAASGRWH